jgi:hypothetical protein
MTEGEVFEKMEQLDKGVPNAAEFPGKGKGAGR